MPTDNLTSLITGGAGFIGSVVIRYLINHTNYRAVNVDKLTYAGNLESLTSIAESDRYYFEHVNICDSKEMDRILKQYRPQIVMHLAVESHVDRSIDGPAIFIQSVIRDTPFWRQELAVQVDKRFSGSWDQNPGEAARRSRNLKIH